jgi:cell division protein FtsZ
MSDLLFKYDDEASNGAKILVVGVGGAGGNAVDHMLSADLEGVEFAVVNTDAQALNNSSASRRIQIGRGVTRGLGAGAKPEKAVEAVREDEETLRQLVSGMDMVFVTAGMGGGTGTGAAPEIARLAKDAGALTVGVVTLPFDFERSLRRRRADAGVEKLRENVDTLILIQNQRLMGIVDQRTQLREAFKIVDDILMNAVRGISDLITIPGLINLDFADVREVMKLQGEALMGVGRGRGEYGAQAAAERAISSPLLDECSIRGAKKLLVNITGGDQVSLVDVHTATQTIMDAVGDEADLFLGAVTNASLGDEVMVTVIATGIEHSPVDQQSTIINRSTHRTASLPLEPIPAAPRVHTMATAASSQASSQITPFMRSTAKQSSGLEGRVDSPQLSESNDVLSSKPQHRTMHSVPAIMRSGETPAEEGRNLVIDWDDKSEQVEIAKSPLRVTSVVTSSDKQTNVVPAPINLPPRENLEMPTFLRRTMD